MRLQALALHHVAERTKLRFEARRQKQRYQQDCLVVAVAASQQQRGLREAEALAGLVYPSHRLLTESQERRCNVKVSGVRSPEAQGETGHQRHPRAYAGQALTKRALCLRGVAPDVPTVFAVAHHLHTWDAVQLRNVVHGVAHPRVHVDVRHGSTWLPVVPTNNCTPIVAPGGSAA